MRRQLEEKLQAPPPDPLPRKTRPMRALEPPQGRYVRDAGEQPTASQAQPSQPVDSRLTSQASLSSWEFPEPIPAMPSNFAVSVNPLATTVSIVPPVFGAHHLEPGTEKFGIATPPALMDEIAREEGDGSDSSHLDP